jgi:hypothetical protein
VIAVVAVLFVFLRPLENNPLPGWDGAPSVASRWRGAVIGALLCVAGVTLLASIKWGLKDDGLVCMAAVVTALVGARAVAALPVRR